MERICNTIQSYLRTIGMTFSVIMPPILIAIFNGVSRVVMNIIIRFFAPGTTSGFLPNPFKPKEIGEIDLRGKEHSLMLYTV